MSFHVRKFNLVLILIVAILVGNVFCIPSFAAEADDVICDQLTTVCPDGTMQSRTTAIPTSSINLATAGAYHFEGQSYYSTLYTKYCFYGKTSYSIYVTNNGSTTLTAQAKTRTKTYGATTVEPGSSATISLSGMDDSVKFYIAFTSSYNTNVKGYIK